MKQSIHRLTFSLFFFAIAIALFSQNEIPIFSAQSVAPTAERAASIDPILERFWTFDLSSAAIKTHLRSDSEARFELNLPGIGAFRMSLYENGLVESGYKALLGTDDGTIETTAPDLLTLFGTVEGGPENGVALTVGDGFFYGSFQTALGEFFIEPASFLSPDKTADRYIIYNVKDVVPNANRKCGVTEIAEKAHNQPIENANRVGLCLHVEWAIASDFGMYTRYSNNAAIVMAHNVGVMNGVAANYDDEFADDIFFIIATQYVSTTNATSLETTLTASVNALVLLNNFRTWGNAAGFGATTFDIANVWVTRDIEDGGNFGVVGLAYVGVVCGTSRYQIDEDFGGSNPTGTGYSLRVLVAHETGHNFNLSHDENAMPPHPAFIMAPSVEDVNAWSNTGQYNQSIPTLNAFLGTITCLSGCSANFQSATYSSSESSASGTLPSSAPGCDMGYFDFQIPITYSGDPNVGASFSVMVSGGTAVENEDFELVSTSINFGTGSVTRTVNFTVRIYNDAIEEINETIVLQISGSAGNLTSTTVTVISDDKNPPANFSTFITVGSGNVNSSSFLRGTVTDHITQWVIDASEMTGFVANDIISALSFNILSANSTVYNNFTLSYKTTTSTSTGNDVETSGLSTIYSGALAPGSTGWLKINLTTPIIWNGVSNLRFQMCYDNSVAGSNHGVQATSGPTLRRKEAASNGCTIDWAPTYSISSARPNTRLHKGSEIGSLLNDEANTYQESGQTAWFYTPDNKFLASVQQTSGGDIGCLEVKIDRAGVGKLTPSYLGVGNFVSDKTFLLTSASPTAVYDVTLYLSAAEFATWGAAAASLNILKTSGPVSAATTATINTTTTRAIFGPTNTEYRSYKATFTGFSGFAVTNASVVLPLEWLHFLGKMVEKSAVLNWATAFEFKNAGFEIERSTDGVAFENIGFVAGAGDSEVQKNYDFEDRSVLELGARTVFYRLKQVDEDGGSSLSNIVALEIPARFQTFSILPNPTEGNTTILFSNESCDECDFVFEISDVAGRILFTQNLIEKGRALNLGELPAGVYFGSLRSGRESFGTIRIFKK